MLPVKPEISRAVLRYDLCSMRDGEDGPYRWYDGEIRPGQIFAWEPELPHARELFIVTRLDGPSEDEEVPHARGVAVISGGHEPRIWGRSLDEPPTAVSPIRYREVWNDEGRFREAVVPTTFKDQI